MKLSPQTLAQIRDAVREVKQSGRGAHASLTKLADMLPAGMGLTLDFEAQATLGQPLVVLRQRGQADARFDKLSEREREVAGLVATGLRNKDIALAFGITVATVKDHVHRILEKSGLDSRSAVAARWRGV